MNAAQFQSRPLHGTIQMAWGRSQGPQVKCQKKHAVMWAVATKSLYHSIESWLASFGIPGSRIMISSPRCYSIIPQPIINQPGFRSLCSENKIPHPSKVAMEKAPSPTIFPARNTMGNVLLPPLMTVLEMVQVSEIHREMSKSLTATKLHQALKTRSHKNFPIFFISTQLAGDLHMICGPLGFGACFIGRDFFMQQKTPPT